MKGDLQMFNQELHRRLDGEEEREVCVPVLESFHRELCWTIEKKGLKEDEGLRYILAAGVRAISGWQTPNTPLDQMGQEEKLRFLQDRASSADAAYSMLKFQAYQVMNQNDALEMNLKGLMPQLEATTQRVRDLEEEVRRLRKLVPADERKGAVLVREREEPRPEEKTFADKLRELFRKRS
jgi:hypothetical protein